MPKIAKKESKNFKLYNQLPSELRMMVIDEMSTIDRCKFTECSFSCSKEVRRSKEYIYGLDFYGFSDERLEIYVTFSEELEDGTFEGYIMRFEKEEEGTFVSYSRPYDIDLWRTKLDDSIDLVQYATEHFKNLLQFYQNTIKKLAIFGVKNFDFGLRSLRRLEDLELRGGTNIPQFLSKIRHPLKSLFYTMEKNKSDLIDFEKIYEVEDRFETSYLNLDYAQFCRFSAKRMYIKIGNLTENNIFDFVKSWQYGKIRENFEYCSWNLSGSTFNVNLLFQLLGVAYNGSKMEKINIMHHKMDGNIAKLCYYCCDERNPSLTFDVKNQ